MRWDFCMSQSRLLCGVNSLHFSFFLVLPSRYHSMTDWRSSMQSLRRSWRHQRSKLKGSPLSTGPPCSKRMYVDCVLVREALIGSKKIKILQSSQCWGSFYFWPSQWRIQNKRLRCVIFFSELQGGDQSPKGSTEFAPRAGRQVTALISVGGCRSCPATRQHFLLHHNLVLLLHVPALSLPPGFPRRRGGSQRRLVVTAGDQSAVNGGDASWGRGGSLEENVSGKEQRNFPVLVKPVKSLVKNNRQSLVYILFHIALDIVRGWCWKWWPGRNAQTPENY